MQNSEGALAEAAAAAAAAQAPCSGARGIDADTGRAGSRAGSNVCASRPGSKRQRNAHTSAFWHHNTSTPHTPMLLPGHGKEKQGHGGRDRDRDRDRDRGLHASNCQSDRDPRRRHAAGQLVTEQVDAAAHVEYRSSHAHVDYRYLGNACTSVIGSCSSHPQDMHVHQVISAWRAVGDQVRVDMARGLSWLLSCLASSLCLPRRRI